MTTFVLKKYEEKPLQPDVKKEETPTEQQDNLKEEKSVEIEVSSTIADTVATALYKILENKDTQVSVLDDSLNKGPDIQVVTAECIKKDPLKAFNSITPNTTVCIIVKEQFSTKEEEWFLLNLPNKTNKVFYSLEKAIDSLL